MDCKQIAEQDLLERYLLDQLTEQEREDLEQHYFGCAECFSQLQAALTLQSQLSRYPLPRAEVKGAFFRAAFLWIPALVSAVVLLAIGTWWYSARRHTVQQVVLPRPTTEPASLSPSASLEQLALVEPPPYKAVALRGIEDPAHEQFRAAMQSYSTGSYTRAIAGLRTAVKTEPDVPSFNFYLGTCYLLTGRTDSAVTLFRKTIELGDPAYSEQSHFYLAKIYLKNQDVAHARDELKSSISFHGSKEREAAEILRQLP
ncbi:MAG: hypothetical protein C5B44_05445 [Acidobacteria bacterium]|nr:MAG: hypothetical protein C5B44_05445 [Acidobacteriota bacterium]